MYHDIPLWLALLFIFGGLLALAWSSDRFVAGAASLARNLGVSPFIVGMVIVGFGTSAPELLVSMFAGLSDHTNLSLGNAYGSCVFNIAAILGVAALIRPLAVKPSVVFVSVPVLAAITVCSYMFLCDGVLSRANALVLLAAFAIIMPLYGKIDGKAAEEEEEYPQTPLLASILWTLIGLAAMVGASHILVWGAVDTARALGIDELLIGLTIVAVGTSIPELASAIAASRRNEADMVLGNIVGSNLFNMLAVVGIAGAISPADGFSPLVLKRDLPVLLGATLLLGLFGFNFKKPRSPGAITRLEGALWLTAFIFYMVLTVYQEAFANG